MKLLVFGDIHGNIIALEKVLSSYKDEVDKIVSHGDVVNYGPWSDECVQLLEDIDCICLKGNHEDLFLMGLYLGDNKLVQDFFKATYPNFNHFKIIEQYTDSYKCDNYKIIHTLDNNYYYPDSDISDLNLEYNTIIGHSHYAFHRELPGGKTLTNTGSVGQNRKDLTIIDFVILDTENNFVELKSLTYDPEPVIQEMISRKFPEKCINYYKSKLKK